MANERRTPASVPHRWRAFVRPEGMVRFLSNLVGGMLRASDSMIAGSRRFGVVRGLGPLLRSGSHHAGCHYRPMNRGDSRSTAPLLARGACASAPRTILRPMLSPYEARAYGDLKRHLGITPFRHQA